MQRRTAQDQDSRAAIVCCAQRDNILHVPITDTTPAAEAVLVRIQRAVTGEQRVLLALEMSLFARELSKAGHSARSSRLDGCAGGARSLEDRILAAALAAQTAMNIEVVFRKITAALNQAGIQLHAGWIICQHLLRRGAVHSKYRPDDPGDSRAAARICSESAQRGILCRLGCPGKLSCLRCTF